MVIDPGGVHWRHDDPIDPDDRDAIIVAFTKWDEPPGENFESMTAWAQRFPSRAGAPRCRRCKDVSDVHGWAGLYEMTPDHNPVLGEHPALAASSSRTASAATG